MITITVITGADCAICDFRRDYNEKNEDFTNRMSRVLYDTVKDCVNKNRGDMITLTIKVDDRNFVANNICESSLNDHISLLIARIINYINEYPCTFMT